MVRSRLVSTTVRTAKFFLGTKARNRRIKKGMALAERKRIRAAREALRIKRLKQKRFERFIKAKRKQAKVKFGR